MLLIPLILSYQKHLEKKISGTAENLQFIYKTTI